MVSMCLFPIPFTFQWNFPLSCESEVILNLCLWYCSHFHGSRLWYHQWRIMPFLCVLAIKNYGLWDKTSIYQAFSFSPCEAGKLLLNPLESSLGNGVNESRNILILAGDTLLEYIFLMREENQLLHLVFSRLAKNTSLNPVAVLIVLLFRPT